MNTLSKARPFPSILIATFNRSNRSVNLIAVNWLPWSLLKTSGREIGHPFYGSRKMAELFGVNRKRVYSSSIRRISSKFSAVSPPGS